MNYTREAYIRGLELFNSREFFLAHEALEDAWREASVKNRQFIQGLVQVAAAFHHYAAGNREGAQGVLARAIRNLAPYPDGFAGIDLLQLRRDLTSLADALKMPESEPALPMLRWDVRMIESAFP